MSITPTNDNESMVLDTMRESLTLYIDHGTPNERSVARLALRLLNAVPDHPAVTQVLNQYAIEAIDRSHDGTT